MKHITVKKKCTKENCPGELIALGTGRISRVESQWDHKCTKCHASVKIKDIKYPYEFNEYDENEKEVRWE